MSDELEAAGPHQNGALAMSAFTIVPRHVIGKGFVAPSDKLRIAGIGVGGKGQGDISEFAKSPNVDIVALVDVDDRAAAKSRQSFPKANYYHDFREMLEKEKNNIDACSISTPDNTHAVATIAAMQLGKHVYTQKPLTHDIYEARVLTEAAKKYKVVTQMGKKLTCFVDDDIVYVSLLIFSLFINKVKELIIFLKF